MNKKISNNYKDYKYVYTGHEDYMKKHHLDKKEILQEKDKIIHDHRNVFDFNNPNQHTHDYSFDFSQNEKPKKTVYKDRYGNVYNNKPQQTTSSYQSPKTTSSIYKKTTKKKSGCGGFGCLIVFFILAFNIIPIMIGIFDALSYKEEILPESNDSIEAFCSSVANANMNSVDLHILPIIKNSEKYNEIKKIVYDYNEYSNTYTYSRNRSCGNKIYEKLDEDEIEELEYKLYYKYNVTYLISELYEYEIKIINDYNDIILEKYKIKIGKINSIWYILDIEEF